MKVIIRPLTKNDFAELARMRVLIYGEIPPDTNEREISELFERTDKYQIFIAEDVEINSAAGFVEASLRDYAENCETSPVGYIEGWFVDENYRLQGVGRELIAAAENWAREQGCTEMASDCLLENQISVAAHTRLGYQETERLIHFRKPLGVS